MTSTTRRDRTAAPVALTAARSVLAALLAVVTTFWPQPERGAAFGLTVLAGFLLLQSVVLGLGARGSSVDRPGRTLLLVRALVSAVGGAVAIVGLSGGTGILVPLEAVVFLVLGVLELTGGLRRTHDRTAGDAIVVGGLQALVGVLLTILDTDVLLAIGVLSAWSAVVAVYLGIAAANLTRRVDA